MFTDNYTNKINDGFEVKTTSIINKNVDIIEMCGVKVKDIIEYSGEVCFIPFNIREAISRKTFLQSHGFIIEDNMIVKKR